MAVAVGAHPLTARLWLAEAEEVAQTPAQHHLVVPALPVKEIMAALVLWLVATIQVVEEVAQAQLVQLARDRSLVQVASGYQVQLTAPLLSVLVVVAPEILMVPLLQVAGATAAVELVELFLRPQLAHQELELVEQSTPVVVVVALEILLPGWLVVVAQV